MVRLDTVNYFIHQKTNMLYNEAIRVVIPLVDTVMREAWLNGEWGHASRITGVTTLLSTRDSYPIFKIFESTGDNFASSQYYMDVVLEKCKGDILSEFGVDFTYKVIHHLNYKQLEISLVTAE